MPIGQHPLFRYSCQHSHLGYTWKPALFSGRMYWFNLYIIVNENLSTPHSRLFITIIIFYSIPFKFTNLNGITRVLLLVLPLLIRIRLSPVQGYDMFTFFTTKGTFPSSRNTQSLFLIRFTQCSATPQKILKYYLTI